MAVAFSNEIVFAGFFKSRMVAIITALIIPNARGRSISRDPENILEEAVQLSNVGYREITLK